MKSLVKPRELSQRPREFDLGVCQLKHLRGARPLVAAPKDLSESCSIERACLVFAVEVEDVLHFALLIHEGHQLISVKIEDPKNLLAELLNSSTLLAADSSILSKRQCHKGCTRRMNDRLTLIESRF